MEPKKLRFSGYKPTVTKLGDLDVDEKRIF